MILGPMCVNDNSPAEFEKMIKHIRGIRGDFSKLQSELESLAKSLQGNKKGGMSVESVRNCTRFPISVLKYCDWVDSENLKIYGKSVRFMKLTSHGRDTVKKLKMLQDIRLDDYEKSSLKQKQALIRLGTYAMLGRAKFDLSTVETEIKKDTAECQSILKGKEILFSPYQTLEFSVVNRAMNFSLDIQKNSNIESKKKTATVYQQKIGRTLSSQLISVDQSAKYNNKYVTQNVQDFAAHVQELHDIAVVDARYGIKKENIHPLAICLGLPNKRTDYWQVVKDILKVTNVQINTVTFGMLLIFLWDLRELNDYDIFYIDVDNSSLRKKAETFLERKIHISVGHFGILENMK